jgi:hypothetical protein
MGNVGINLINAVKNRLIPIVFKINNTHEFDIVASVEFSKYEVTVRVWKSTKRGGKFVINLDLKEIDDKIEVNKEYLCRHPKSVETYADLISELKKYLTKDYAK